MFLFEQTQEGGLRLSFFKKKNDRRNIKMNQQIRYKRNSNSIESILSSLKEELKGLAKVVGRSFFSPKSSLLIWLQVHGQQLLACSDTCSSLCSISALSKLSGPAYTQLPLRECSCCQKVPPPPARSNQARAVSSLSHCYPVTYFQKSIP